MNAGWEHEYLDACIDGVVGGVDNVREVDTKNRLHRPTSSPFGAWR